MTKVAQIPTQDTSAGMKRCCCCQLLGAKTGTGFIVLDDRTSSNEGQNSRWCTCSQLYPSSFGSPCMQPYQCDWIQELSSHCHLAELSVAFL